MYALANMMGHPTSAGYRDRAMGSPRLTAAPCHGGDGDRSRSLRIISELAFVVEVCCLSQAQTEVKT